MKMKCPLCHAWVDADTGTCPECSALLPKPVVMVEPVARRGYARPCSAYGCPLGGTFSPTTLGETDTWWCFAHSAFDGHPLQEITALVRRNRDLLDRVVNLSQQTLYTDFDRKRHLGEYGAARRELLNAITKGLKDGAQEESKAH